MNPIETKYSLLTESEKKQIDEAIDLILFKKKNENSFNSISYKANLLKVSTWSEEEIKDLEQNLEKFGKWPIENW